MPSKKKSFLPAALNIFLALFLLFGIFFSFHEALAAAAGCVCNNEANCPSQRFVLGSMSALEVYCTQYCTGLGGLCPRDGGGVARFTPYWPCVCCDGTDLVERSEEACGRDCGEHGGVATGGDPAALHVSDCPETPGVRPPGCYCDGTLYEMACSAESDCRSSRCSLSTTVSCVPGYTPPTSRIPGCYCSGTLTREMACTTFTDCQETCPSGTATTDIMCAPGYSPPPARASGTSGSGDPDNNPLCWRKIQCENNCPVDGGCIFQDSSEYPPCSGGAGDWGRCLPKSAPITLQIPIMGVKDITDLSAYIALMYRYLISIGGILAGIMIVIGGLLYLTAGTSDRVSSAKSYISSALIGLVLLLTSYLLLQTVNPQLVQISSFTIPLIRPARMPARFCNEYPTPAAGQPPLKFASARGSSGATRSLSELRETDFSITDTSTMRCGATYYEQASGDETCLGYSCENTRAPGAGHPGACVPTTDDEKTWDCLNVAWAGKITSSKPIKDIVLTKTGGDGDICTFAEDVSEKIWPDFYYVPRASLPTVASCDYEGFQLSFKRQNPILQFDEWGRVAPYNCASNPPSDQQVFLGEVNAFHYEVLDIDDSPFRGPVICDINFDTLEPSSYRRD